MRRWIVLALVAMAARAQPASLSLRHWVYKVAAQPTSPVDEDWGGALSDGAAGRDRAVGFVGPDVLVAVDLGGWCEVTGLRVIQHHPTVHAGPATLHTAYRRGERWIFAQAEQRGLPSRDKVDETRLIALGRCRTDALQLQFGGAEHLYLSEIEITGRRLGPRPLLDWTGRLAGGPDAPVAELCDGLVGAARAIGWRGPTVTIEADLGGYCEVTSLDVYERGGPGDTYRRMSVRSLRGEEWIECNSHEGADATEGEPVYRIPLNNVRTTRLRLVYEGAQRVALSEIEMFGRRLGEAPAGGGDGSPPFRETDGPVAWTDDLDGDGRPEGLLENASLRVVVAGDGSGALRSLRRKPDGLELLGRTAGEEWSGEGTAFEPPAYGLVAAQEPRAALLLAPDEGEGLPTKTIWLDGDGPALRLDYLAAPRVLALLRLPLGPPRGGNAFFYPTPRGIRSVAAAETHPVSIPDPPRGWLAVAGPQADGVAVECLTGAPLWFAHEPAAGAAAAALVAGLRPVAGRLELRLTAFAGLPRIDGVVDGFVCALDASTIEHKLLAAALIQAPLGRQAEVAAELRPLAGGAALDLGRAVAGDGALLRLPLEARDLSRGGYVVRLTLSRDGRELGTVETPVSVDRAPIEYELKPLVRELGPVPPTPAPPGG